MMLIISKIIYALSFNLIFLMVHFIYIGLNKFL